MFLLSGRRARHYDLLHYMILCCITNNDSHAAHGGHAILWSPVVGDVTWTIRGPPTRTDLVRKVKLAFAPRLRSSASGAALLDEAFQVGQYFILLHIIMHYLHVSIMNPGIIHTRSGRRRLLPMGWIQFFPSTLRFINCSKKIIRNRLSATAVHRGPVRTHPWGPFLPCS